MMGGQFRMVCSFQSAPPRVRGRRASLEAAARDWLFQSAPPRVRGRRRTVGAGEGGARFQSAPPRVRGRPDGGEGDGFAAGFNPRPPV